jgi:UDP-glucuronate decarboxylase
MLKWSSEVNILSKILVTGGAGFIGSHLCHKLVQSGNSVVCLDNLYTGLVCNINDLLDNKNFSFIQCDIENAPDIGVEQIYNLACPASPPHYQKNPVKTIRTSVIGIMNMLELARKYGATLLQASTSEVYGNPLEHPQSEEYWGNVNPIGIRSCYDEGKRCAETLLFDYNRQFGVDTRVVRIFNTYGPNMAIDDGRVVSNFIVQALKGEDITIYGDGTQTRSFCYVSDLVDGIMKMMNSNCVTTPINLGNPNERTVLELAELIIRKIGSSSKIVFKELPQDDPIKRKPDIRKAKKLLGWQPTIDIDKGLDLTIEYFKSK